MSQLKVMTRPQHHPSSCLLAANLTLGGSRRRSLIPSLHQQGRRSPVIRSLRTVAAQRFVTGPSTPYGVNSVGEAFTSSPRAVQSSGPELNRFGSTRLGAINGKPSMSASVRDGLPHAPGSAQKFQFFHNRHAPWLLFGLCIGLSAAAGSLAPHIVIGSPPALAEALAKRAGLPTASSSRSQTSENEGSHGKRTYTEYTVTGVPGDGRCLFRAVAHGACLRSGKPAPDESTQRRMADDLRNKALDELVRRQETTEWFIEGDFNTYVSRMRQPHTWGGEPELLMLSYVLEMPITVYMEDKGGIISIAEYGQEYGTDNPIRVLYHGFGHYEALQLPEDRRTSRL